MPSRILASGQSLGPDQTLESANRRYSLTMQADGNLVLSEIEGGGLIFDQFLSPTIGYLRYISAVTSKRLIVAPESPSSRDPGVTIEFSRDWIDIAEIDYRP
jgi:hypothetical protein